MCLLKLREDTEYFYFAVTMLQQSNEAKLTCIIENNGDGMDRNPSHPCVCGWVSLAKGRRRGQNVIGH